MATDHRLAQYFPGHLALKCTYPCRTRALTAATGPHRRAAGRQYLPAAAALLPVRRNATCAAGPLTPLRKPSASDSAHCLGPLPGASSVQNTHVAITPRAHSQELSGNPSPPTPNPPRMPHRPASAQCLGPLPVHLPCKTSTSQSRPEPILNNSACSCASPRLRVGPSPPLGSPRYLSQIRAPSPRGFDLACQGRAKKLAARAVPPFLGPRLRFRTHSAGRNVERVESDRRASASPLDFGYVEAGTDRKRSARKVREAAF